MFIGIRVPKTNGTMLALMGFSLSFHIGSEEGREEASGYKGNSETLQ